MMEPINTAFILPSFAAGGAERVTIHLVNNLDRKLINPILVVVDGSGPLQAMVGASVRIENLAIKRVRDAMPSMMRAIKANNVEQVFSTFTHINLAVLFSRLLLRKKWKIVVRESNSPLQSLPNQKYGGIMGIGCKALYRQADAIVCQTGLIAQQLERVFGIPQARLTILPNPIDTEAIRKVASSSIRKSGNGRRFVAAGRITRQKGFDRLVSLVERLDDADHTTILGDGPEFGRLKALIQRAGLEHRIELLGQVDLPWPIYAGADAFLSTSRWEGLQNAALEALACGTPVIALPEAGGINEVAAESVEGAVTVSAFEEEYLNSLQNISPRSRGGLRECLLPSKYFLSNSIKTYQSMFLSI